MLASIVKKVRRHINALITVVVALSMAILFSVPLRAHGNLLPYAQDDFYYYLVVARNLANGVGSTFDGRTLTNGYHPLYLLLLWGVCYVAKSLRAIFGFLALIDTISAVCVFLGARAFFTRASVSVWWSNALAVLAVMVFRAALCEQMEVTLAIPLAILFLLLLQRSPAAFSPRSSAVLGIVGALLVLARLDAALLVGLCGLFALLDSRYRRVFSPVNIACFLGGFLPLPTGYLLLDRHIFHRFTPISGAAKQMEVVHEFSRRVLLYSLTPGMRLAFLGSAIAMILLSVVWTRLSPQQRVVCAAALLFPFVHWGANLWLSDWPLWPWYTYSIRLSIVAILGLLAVLYLRPLGERWPLTGRFALLGSLVFLLISNHYTVGSNMVDTAKAATAIGEFATSHHGRYAMGDRAGMAGFVNTQPTLQTEGLMMDGAYLEHIRRQESLNSVLKLYGVDYYVAFEEKRGNGNYMGPDGCFHATEPAQAGEHSPQMHGVFCQAPLMAYLTPTGETRIFDLRHR